MEYLPDGDLQQYLRAPLLEKEARDIIHQVIEGLEFMHDNGFTHRDLKPAVSSAMRGLINLLLRLIVSNDIESIG